MFTSATSRESFLLTGVSSGIGFGLARTLLAQGHRVFGSVRSAEKAEALRTDLEGSFVPLVFDVRNEEQVAEASAILAEKLKGQHLAALVNNAGSAEIGPLLQIPIEDFRDQLDTLAVGQLTVTQQFFRHLRQTPGDARGGRVINISSVSGTRGNRFFGAYVAGKHALEGLSKTLRDEVAQFGVRVIVVAPGNIATPIWSKQSHSVIQKYRDTPYYEALEQTVDGLESWAVRTSMTVEEFCGALLRIVSLRNPADRYTVVKSRRPRVPFSRSRVRIIPG